MSHRPRHSVTVDRQLTAAERKQLTQYSLLCHQYTVIPSVYSVIMKDYVSAHLLRTFLYMLADVDAITYGHLQFEILK